VFCIWQVANYSTHVILTLGILAFDLSFYIPTPLNSVYSMRGTFPQSHTRYIMVHVKETIQLPEQVWYKASHRFLPRKIIAIVPSKTKKIMRNATNT